MWDNRLRYLSESGVLGLLRASGWAMGIKGGPSEILRKNGDLLVSSADWVHKKGMAAWEHYSKS